MRVYTFGDHTKPVILLLPGTCCHWKANFGGVIPLLEPDFLVACVSYDGFDETEQTVFPDMLAETEKIERVHTGLLRRPHLCRLWLLAGRLLCGPAGPAGEDPY